MEVQLQRPVLTREDDPVGLNVEAYRVRHSDPAQGAAWAQKAYTQAGHPGELSSILNNLTLTYQRVGRWAEALEAVP